MIFSMPLENSPHCLGALNVCQKVQTCVNKNLLLILVLYRNRTVPEVAGQHNLIFQIHVGTSDANVIVSKVVSYI